MDFIKKGLKKSLRPDEVADHLDVSIRTIYRLINDGELIAFPARRRGLRIEVKELERYKKRKITEYQERNDIFVTQDDIV